MTDAKVLRTAAIMAKLAILVADEDPAIVIAALVTVLHRIAQKAKISDSLLLMTIQSMIDLKPSAAPKH